MEERGMNERVRMLRRQSVETQPHIYMERAKLMTEAYKLYDCLLYTSDAADEL